MAMPHFEFKIVPIFTVRAKDMDAALKLAQDIRVKTQIQLGIGSEVSMEGQKLVSCGWKLVGCDPLPQTFEEEIHNA